MSLRLLAIALVASGCVPAYRPPATSEPHAIVKLRRVYERRAGTTLSETAAIGDAVALRRSSNALASSAPLVDAIRVAPKPTTITLVSSFSHVETEKRDETYWETIPDTKTETYECGTPDSPSTCTRTVDDTHTEMRTRTVETEVEVSDGACSRRIDLHPVVGGVYLLDFTYRSDRSCRLVCYQQLPDEHAFRNVPCPP